MLLLRLHRLALRLRPFMPWCYALGLGAAAFTAILLLRGHESDSQWLSVALGVTIWALMIFAFTRLFHSIPPPVLPTDSFFERLQGRCTLALYHLLAFGIVIVSMALVVITFKLLSASF